MALNEYFLALGIVRRSQIRGRGITPTRDADLITSVQNELGADPFGIFHVAHADRGAKSLTVGAGGRIADSIAVTVNRLAAPEHGAWVQEDKGHELPF